MQAHLHIGENDKSGQNSPPFKSAKNKGMSRREAFVAPKHTALGVGGSG